MSNTYGAQLEIFRVAAAKGLPLFPQEIEKSNALNASPYLISMMEFAQHFGGSERRRDILGKLRAVVDEAAETGALPVSLLAGGSFLRAENHNPKDLDAICFYTTPPDINCAAKLVALSQSARTRSLDVRFVPYDADPVIALKVCSFFTSLYSSVKRADVLPQAIVLVHDLLK